MDELRSYGLDVIVRDICQRHGLPPKLILEKGADGSRRRYRSHVRCRAEILLTVRTMRGWSYPQLGELFGMDHTSVMHLIHMSPTWGIVPIIPSATTGQVPDSHPTTGEQQEALPPDNRLPNDGTKPEQPVDIVGEPSRALASRAHSESGSSISQLSVLKSNSDSESSCLQAGAREGEPESSSRQIERVVTKTKRKSPELPLPADWAPDHDHRDMAKSKGIDVDSEAAAFRAHAEAHDRRCVRWDAAFRQWLLKAEQRPRKTPTKTLIQRDDDSKRLWKIPEGF